MVCDGFIPILTCSAVSAANDYLVWLVADQYDEIDVVDAYAGIKRPIWPPSWPPWRLEPQLWLMEKRGDE